MRVYVCALNTSSFGAWYLDLANPLPPRRPSLPPSSPPPPHCSVNQAMVAFMRRLADLGRPSRAGKVRGREGEERLRVAGVVAGVVVVVVVVLVAVVVRLRSVVDHKVIRRGPPEQEVPLGAVVGGPGGGGEGGAVGCGA